MNAREMDFDSERVAMIEVGYDAAHSEDAHLLIEEAVDNLMADLIHVGVVDPGISTTLDVGAVERRLAESEESTTPARESTQ